MTDLDRSSSMNVYQILSRATYRDIGDGSNLIYPILGLTNEAGEVAGKYKKIMRDQDGVITHEDRVALRDELGDVLWYLAQIATNLNYSLSEIADANLIKILSRLQRGVIGGSGDQR